MAAEVTRITSNGYVRSLRNVTKADVALVGAKAASLGELSRAGFPVPDGFVLTTRAFDSFTDVSQSGASSSSDAVSATPLPSDVAEAIKAISEALGDGPLAVRSSAVAEDLAGASYAGQYETVLDVRGVDALTAAVRRCWASAFAERVSAYRDGTGQASQGISSRMAVLVQRLVPAEAAGVAFTANPVTGDRGEVLVSAVRGLGDRLVSGQASPDEWVVRGQEAALRSSREDAVDASQVQHIAEMARRIEGMFGRPQDVEWAIEGGVVYLLQARPITGLPSFDREGPAGADSEPIVPPGFWESASVNFPRSVTPSTRSMLAMLNAAWEQGVAETGALYETLEWREIGGWVYSSVIPLDRRYGKPPPAWLMPLLVRVVPALRKRIKQSVEFIRTDQPARCLRRWYEEWKPYVTAHIAELRNVELGALSGEELDRHMSRLIEFSTDCLAIHFRLHQAIAPALAELAFICREALGWDEVRTFDMLAGLSAKSTEPASRLADLAQMAMSRPAVRSLLDNLSEDTPVRLAEVDREFAAAFAAYQQEFGCRTMRYEVDYQTVAECPTLVLELIRGQLARGYDPQAEESAQEKRRAETLAEARTALAKRSVARRERFERALARAEMAYPLREDSQFYTTGGPLALGRYAFLEAGKRLADRGVIARCDDVFYLEIEEARAALRDGGDRQAFVQSRRAERAWAEAHPGPATYGPEPGPPPPLGALPSEARFVNEAQIWYVQHILGQKRNEPQQLADSDIRGLAVSPGRYTGPARIVMDESQFGKLRPGDVLVCPITSPVWSMLFPSVGALVTDTGGILSHPAIIAREYRIPAVVATGDATQLLRDGQVVTVDGSVGLVAICAVEH